jgi:hypothetical protein
MNIYLGTLLPAVYLALEATRSSVEGRNSAERLQMHNEAKISRGAGKFSQRANISCLLHVSPTLAANCVEIQRQSREPFTKSLS